MPEDHVNVQAPPGRLVFGAERDSTISRRAEWIHGLPIFFNFTQAECREVVSAAHEKQFLRRQTIFLEGAPCKQVILVLSGCVKTTQLGPTGCEVILRLSGPGELVGALESYLGSNNLVTAKTTQPTTALVWDSSVFEQVSDRFPVLRRNTARLLGVRLQELEERFREISTQKVAPRLSQQLVRLSNQLRQHTNGALEISLSREELAQLTGTTLFTVSRLLSHWERQGIVSTRREAVVVRDLHALMQVSEAG
jgi:CRP/FNR family transcriptional regulator, nitrogen oxide reductase regulator